MRATGLNYSRFSTYINSNSTSDITSIRHRSRLDERLTRLKLLTIKTLRGPETFQRWRLFLEAQGRLSSSSAYIHRVVAIPTN